ncbi:hypothetical protein ABW21_db0204900 [Orbilia brochopaga]|nr:hypothetical protein ABW21_db0204900 [Drechslerella brochopaga]
MFRMTLFTAGKRVFGRYKGLGWECVSGNRSRILFLVRIDVPETSNLDRNILDWYANKVRRNFHLLGFKSKNWFNLPGIGRSKRVAAELSVARGLLSRQGIHGTSSLKGSSSNRNFWTGLPRSTRVGNYAGLPERGSLIL